MVERPKTTHFEGVNVMELLKAAEQTGVIMGVGANNAFEALTGGRERKIRAREEGDERQAAKVAPLRKSASLESLQCHTRESGSAQGE